MIRIRDEQPGSCFRELRNNFCLFKIHFMMWIQDSGSGIWDEKKIGSGMENFWIRDKHTRSATLVLTNDFLLKFFFLPEAGVSPSSSLWRPSRASLASCTGASTTPSGRTHIGATLLLANQPPIPRNIMFKGWRKLWCGLLSCTPRRKRSRAETSPLTG